MWVDMPTHVEIALERVSSAGRGDLDVPGSPVHRPFLVNGTNGATGPVHGAGFSVDQLTAVVPTPAGPYVNN